MEMLERLFDAVDARIPANDWDALADDIRTILKCDFVTCYTVRLPAEIPRQAKILMTTNRPVMEDYFEREIYRLQLINEDELPGFAPFKISDYIATDKLRNHPHYTQWGKTIGFFHILFAPLLISSSELLVLGVSRSEAGSDFDDQDCSCVGLAARYLRRYVQAQNATQSDGTIDLSGYFDVPVAVVKGRELLSTNAAFRSWCSASGLVQIEDDGRALSFPDAGLRHDLAHATAKLENTKIDPAAPPKTQIGLSVGGKSQGRYVLQVMPLVGENKTTGRQIWFVHNANPNKDVAALGTEAGLTPTEIETFSHLAQGNSARSIAQITGQSDATVRWHIRNILAKCGVRSQKELLAKLFNGTV